MAAPKITLFGKTKALEAQIDEFLDTLSQGGMLFEEIVKHYMSHGADETFNQRIEQIGKIESNGDRLTRNIIRALYTEMLIPESRADVLSLLQDLDYMLDMYEHASFAIDVERPDIHDVPEERKKALEELCHLAVESVEVLIAAARSFFRDVNAVRDHLHKVHFYEAESDKVAMQLKREIFRSNMPLERKLHSRDFIDRIDSIADEAEDAADWLAVYTIKRSL